ncbi:NCS2 family permease [Paraglaciecola psychrophila]|uniref:Xanthine/uracil/vitamin C permease n=1 Tax=Paraglaciecola psychrophila 170 TaxID=1129794 RepID=K6Z103_9ALTE|nr:NCS2 family permease [Paraglaciecola psychrophila]AGH45136.1 xanthine/uracil/vitamin C permease [Paraglaciecola psychrophila 170]GAC38724.1 guanine/hypoxanthine permease pbuO [Paraglaciecola psychrophila 170]
MSNILEHFFKLKEKGTNLKTEFIAGLTTFAAMSYVLVVNPSILGAGGMPIEGLITVTAIAACLGTLLMAFMTNYPIAMAPGMGLNAFFAFTICLTREIPWDAALGIVFWNGILFLLLSVTGVRTKIADAIPAALKIGVQCGIGLFIAFIGLKNAGLVVDNPATFVSIGDLSEPATLLALAGIILTIVLVIRKVTGAILISVIVLTIIGAFIPVGDGYLTQHTSQIIGLPDSISTTFFAMDIMYPIEYFAETWDLIFALLFVNMFDTIGTLIGVSRRANLLDEHGKLPKMGKAMTADAVASVMGAAIGTSPVTSYVESAAGVSAGGRTGLTSVFVALCFILALFLTPLMKVIPLMATTPALIMVGILMMDSFRQLDFDDLTSLATATVALLAMPLTFSISEGIALGFITYVGIMLGTGRYKQVTLITYIMAIVFVLRYVLDLK